MRLLFVGNFDIPHCPLIFLCPETEFCAFRQSVIRPLPSHPDESSRVRPPFIADGIFLCQECLANTFLDTSRFLARNFAATEKCQHCGHVLIVLVKLMEGDIHLKAAPSDSPHRLSTDFNTLGALPSVQF